MSNYHPSDLIGDPLYDIKRQLVDVSMDSIKLENGHEINGNHMNLFKVFFQTMQHPSFIIDLNINITKTMPYILNKAADLLITSTKISIYNESYLENFNGTMSEYIYSVRQKPLKEICYYDILHIIVENGSETTENIFSFTASSFFLDKDTKMLGIVLMEITRTIKQEINALNAFKTSLISSLNHELNNPMNSLIPLLKMMPSCIGDRNTDDLKEMALASANILQIKIRDLIDYAKIEMKSIRINETNFYVDELFEKINKIFKYEVQEKSNTLIVEIKTKDSRRLKVFGDKNRIEQVLIKLVSNANKYTSKGKILLSAVESINNFNVIFLVKDTGIGIPKSKQDFIFESLTKKARHLDVVARLPGLGLEIAKNLCKVMKCVLKLESEEGKGTKFFFEIPVCRVIDFKKSPQDESKECKNQELPNEEIMEASSIKSGKWATIPVIEDKKSEFPFKKSSYKKFRSINQKIITEGSFKGALESIFTKFKHKPALSFEIAKKKNYQVMTSVQSPRSDEDCDVSEETQVHKVVQFYQMSSKSPTSYSIHHNDPIFKRTKQNVVLIVDDLYSNRMVLREFLKRMKIDSIEANNGSEAIVEVKNSFQDNSNIEIGLILMDLNMPY